MQKQGVYEYDLVCTDSDIGLAGTMLYQEPISETILIREIESIEYTLAPYNYYVIKELFVSSEGYVYNEIPMNIQGAIQLYM